MLHKMELSVFGEEGTPCRGSQLQSYHLSTVVCKARRVDDTGGVCTVSTWVLIVSRARGGEGTVGALLVHSVFLSFPLKTPPAACAGSLVCHHLIGRQRTMRIAVALCAVLCHAIAVVDLPPFHAFLLFGGGGGLCHPLQCSILFCGEHLTRAQLSQPLAGVERASWNVGNRNDSGK